MNAGVVVTGIGAVSALGLGGDRFWQGVRGGRTGIGPVDLFETGGLAAKTAGQVRGFRAKDHLPKKGLRNLNRAINFSRTAAKLALRDSGLETATLDPSRIGIVLGTNTACADHMFAFDRDSIRGLADPLHFPNTGVSAPACQISVFEGFHAFTSTFSSGQGAGLEAIAFGAMALERGDADVVIAGGVESLCEDFFALADARGELYSRKPGEPPWPGPFHPAFSGRVPGEGAACLVLERSADAVARGAWSRARIGAFASGFGSGSFKRTAPDPGPMAVLMEEGLSRQSLDAGAVDCLLSAAQGMDLTDRAEALAIQALFGPSAARPRGVPVSAVAAFLGDTSGASGAFLAIWSVLALQHQCLSGFPALPGVARSYPLNLIQTAHPARIRHCLLTAFGSLGEGAVLLMAQA